MHLDGLSAILFPWITSASGHCKIILSPPPTPRGLCILEVWKFKLQKVVPIFLFLQVRISNTLYCFIEHFVLIMEHKRVYT